MLFRKMALGIMAISVTKLSIVWFSIIILIITLSRAIINRTFNILESQNDISIMTLSMMTLSTMTLSIMTLSIMTLSIMTLSIKTVSLIIQHRSIFMFCSVLHSGRKLRKCRLAECR